MLATYRPFISFKRYVFDDQERVCNVATQMSMFDSATDALMAAYDQPTFELYRESLIGIQYNFARLRLAELMALAESDTKPVQLRVETVRIPKSEDYPEAQGRVLHNVCMINNAKYRRDGTDHVILGLKEDVEYVCTVYATLFPRTIERVVTDPTVPPMHRPATMAKVLADMHSAMSSTKNRSYADHGWRSGHPVYEFLKAWRTYLDRYEV